MGKNNIYVYVLFICENLLHPPIHGSMAGKLCIGPPANKIKEIKNYLKKKIKKRGGRRRKRKKKKKILLENVRSYLFIFFLVKLFITEIQHQNVR